MMHLSTEDTSGAAYQGTGGKQDSIVAYQSKLSFASTAAISNALHINFNTIDNFIIQLYILDCTLCLGLILSCPLGQHGGPLGDGKKAVSTSLRLLYSQYMKVACEGTQSTASTLVYLVIVLSLGFRFPKYEQQKMIRGLSPEPVT